MKKDSLEKKIAAYVTLAAAYLAAHPVDADAQIMYTDVNPDLVIHNSYFNLDLNNDGVVDFKLEHSENHVNGTINWGDQYLANIQCLNNNEVIGTYGGWYGLVSNLNQGYSINQNAIFNNGNILHRHIIAYHYNYTSSHSTTTNAYTFGNFSGANGYLGLKIISNGSTYYGWARVNVNDHQIVLKDYAINLAPDSTILAGETGTPCTINSISTNPSGSLTLCDSITVQLFNSNGLPIQWMKNGAWLNGETDSTITINQPGDYQAMVQDSAGCAVVVNAVQLSRIEISLDDTIPDHCEISAGVIKISVVGGQQPYIYLWSNGIISQDNYGIPAGLYFVTVTDNSGCAVTDSFNLTNQFNAPLISETHIDSVCNPNASIDITVSGGAAPYSYSWNNGMQTQDLFNLSTGNYSLIVTDDNDCPSSISIQINNPMPGVFLNSNPATCLVGGSIDLTASGGIPPYTFQWNNGSTSEDVISSPAGNYSITVTDNNGCTIASTISIINSNLPTPVITELNNTLFSSYLGKNQWYYYSTTNPLIGDTFNYYNPTSYGTFYAEAIYSDTCSVMSIPFVFWFDDVKFISSSEISYTILNKKLLLHLPDNSLLSNQLEIINELGQLVSTVSVTNQTPEADLSALPSGIYFFHIRSKQKTLSGKFFIE